MAFFALLIAKCDDFQPQLLIFTLQKSAFMCSLWAKINDQSSKSSHLALQNVHADLIFKIQEALGYVCI